MFISAIGFAAGSVASLVHVVCSRHADGLVRAAAEMTTLAAIVAGVVFAVGPFHMLPGDWSDPCGARGDLSVIGQDEERLPSQQRVRLGGR